MAFEQYAYSKYNREVKKLPKPVQNKVISVQDEIAGDPFSGKPLKGKLRSWRRYKFSCAGQGYCVAYKVDKKRNRVIFGSVGAREGFYNRFKGWF